MVDERIPPESPEAESCTLGSMILDKGCIDPVAQILQADDFYRLEHRHIFNAILSRYESSGELDLVLLRDELKLQGKIDDVGGVEFIQMLAESVPSATNALYYAQIVRNKALQRQVIKLCTKYQADAFDHQKDVQGFVEQFESDVFQLSQANTKTDDTPFPKVVDDVIDSIVNGTGSQGLPTGYTDYDELAGGGLHNGNLIIIAARPSMGKTSLALNIAENVTFGQKKPVLIFSLEMSKQELIRRLIVLRSGIGSLAVRGPYLSRDQKDQIRECRDEIVNAPVHIDDSARNTPLQILSRARYMKARYGIELVIVDYLQLMDVPGKDRMIEAVTYISRQIKLMARELDVPVILLSQLNRGPEQREDHRPRLCDLRESGAIEQDADAVLFLYRGDYYTKHLPGFVADNIGELIISKQRNGPTGKIEMIWDGGLMKFKNKTMWGGAINE